MSVHFSSKTDLWETPQNLFDELNAKYGFSLDVCAIPENAKCIQFYTPEEDGLKQQWFGRCWMNPPYGRGIKEWIKKAFWSSVQNDALVVCLVPSRTDTKWWHEYVIPHASSITYIKGRLKFGGHKNSAPFPSAIVVFGRAD